jgi:hypothetical protein
MTLEELIASQTTAANANTEAAVLGETQKYDNSLGAMQTEQGEIDPYYNTLINETNKGFKNTLGMARTSAAGRGAFWGSGGLSNVEMSIGQENNNKVSEFGAERTRKLADISRRRSLLTKERDENINSLRKTGGANLESAIAGLRYDEFKRQEEARLAREKEERDNAQRMREIYASKTQDKDTTAQDRADSENMYLNQAFGMHGKPVEGSTTGELWTRESLARWIASQSPGTTYEAMRDKLYQLIPNQYNNSTQETSGGGFFSNLFGGSGTTSAPFNTKPYGIKDTDTTPSWYNFGQ